MGYWAVGSRKPQNLSSQIEDLHRQVAYDLVSNCEVILLSTFWNSTRGLFTGTQCLAEGSFKYIECNRAL